MASTDVVSLDAPVAASVELMLRVRWRHAPSTDVRIEAETHHNVRDVLDAASASCAAGWEPSQPAYLERTAAPLPLGATIAEAGLVSGDTIRFELYGVEARPRLERAVSLDVLGGPEAGRSRVLRAGRYRCGRDPSMASRSSIRRSPRSTSPSSSATT